MAIFGDRCPSVKFDELGAGPLCHSGRHWFQVLLRLTENFWKDRRCGFSSILEPRDVMVRGFSLAERVLRVSSRRCRLKPEMGREPNVEYDDVSEDNRAGKDTSVAWMQERLGTPLTP
jgi:hypothetical protein